MNAAVASYIKVPCRQSSEESPTPPSPSLRAANNTELSRMHRYTDRRPFLVSVRLLRCLHDASHRLLCRLVSVDLSHRQNLRVRVPKSETNETSVNNVYWKKCWNVNSALQRLSTSENKCCREAFRVPLAFRMTSCFIIEFWKFLNNVPVTFRLNWFQILKTHTRIPLHY